MGRKGGYIEMGMEGRKGGWRWVGRESGDG